LNLIMKKRMRRKVVELNEPTLPKNHENESDQAS